MCIMTCIMCVIVCMGVYITIEIYHIFYFSCFILLSLSLSLTPHSFDVPQVFGGLLMAKPDEGGQDETDSPAPPEGDKPKDGGKTEEEVREQVVEILSCQGRLSGLQKQVRINLVCTCQAFI